MTPGTWPVNPHWCHGLAIRLTDITRPPTGSPWRLCASPVLSVTTIGSFGVKRRRIREIDSRWRRQVQCVRFGMRPSTATSYDWLGTGGSGGIGTYVLPSDDRYTVTTQSDSALRRAAVWEIFVSFIVWAKSQDSLHKPQLLTRKESWSGSNRGPSAYQPRKGNIRLYVHRNH